MEDDGEGMNVVFESSGRTTAVQPPPAPSAAPSLPPASDADVARETSAKRRPHRDTKQPTTTTTAAPQRGRDRLASDKTRVRNPSFASLL